MSLDWLSAIDDPVDLPEGEGAFVPFAQLRQVSRFDGQQIEIEHDAIACSSEPMANRTMLTKLPSSGRRYFCFLRRARGRRQHGRQKFGKQRRGMVLSSSQSLYINANPCS